eukprot:TRINITY_DN21010_c0_g2_i1.p2 TRINITY_DN21010_c0_g2~~TRINITY_DN21010_c0_g2_i1.p2  ORF type:complete len:211 (-),score=36.72 TRINITY_DN21010_c0_g2_i1:1018-1581(-)
MAVDCTVGRIALAMFSLILVADAKHSEQVEVLMDENSLIHLARHTGSSRHTHLTKGSVVTPHVMQVSNASAIIAPATLVTVDPVQIEFKAAPQNSSSLENRGAPKKKKKKKKKANSTVQTPLQQSQQDQGATWLSKDGKLTPLGASVWFLGGAMIGGVVLLLALKPPRLFNKKETKPAFDSECTSGA